MRLFRQRAARKKALKDQENALHQEQEQEETVRAVLTEVSETPEVEADPVAEEDTAELPAEEPAEASEQEVSEEEAPVAEDETARQTVEKAMDSPEIRAVQSALRGDTEENEDVFAGWKSRLDDLPDPKADHHKPHLRAVDDIPREESAFPDFRRPLRPEPADFDLAGGLDEGDDLSTKTDPWTATPAEESALVDLQPSSQAYQTAAGDEDTSFEMPGPAVGRTGRRSGGRVKTRLLGFEHHDGGNDPFAAPAANSTTSETQFPVGWLVVIDGPGRGMSFALPSGVSSIGRGEDQAVRLDFGDTSISRSGHAMLAYDREQKKFFLGHGGKRNIVRLNDKPVLSTEELSGNDLVRIGETVLRFVAFCGPDFDWMDKGETGSHGPDLV